MMSIKMKTKQSNDIGRTKTLKRLFWMLMMIFSVFGTEASSKEWNGIIPCVSTRSEAEKILGKDSFPTPDALGSYRYKKFRVSVYYDRKDKNNPDKNVVEKIRVYPDKSIPLAKYIKKIPNFHRDFRKTEVEDKISHVNGLAYYRNWDEGFELVVQKNDEDVEVITSFGYFDPAYDCSKRIFDSSESNGNNF